MENPIREVSGIEAKHALAQFLGQNLGELKKLDSDIIAGNSSLKGMTIDINQVGNDIPVQRGVVQEYSNNQQNIQPPKFVEQSVSVIIPPQNHINNLPVINPPISSIRKEETNQFEFNFQLTPDKIYDKLDSIERQNKEIISLLKKLSSGSTKKNI